jgi:hypothetical protein
MSRPSQRPARRSFRVLAAILALEVVAAAAVPVAATAMSADRATPLPTHVAGPAGRPVRPAADRATGPTAALPTPRPARSDPPASEAERLGAAGDAHQDARRVAKPAPKPAPTRPAPAKVTRAAYRGVNHVWSQALGLDRGVRAFPCSRTSAPGMAVYRWGCAGANNIYLLAHAGGPFGRLHDLYVSGRLRRGMSVVYADGAGRIHRFVVRWWRVVLPTRGEFAYAALPSSSMTLQTCVGAGDRYRLVVRLSEVR